MYQTHTKALEDDLDKFNFEENYGFLNYNKHLNFVRFNFSSIKANINQISQLRYEIKQHYYQLDAIRKGFIGEMCFQLLLKKNEISFEYDFQTYRNRGDNGVDYLFQDKKVDVKNRGLDLPFGKLLSWFNTNPSIYISNSQTLKSDYYVLCFTNEKENTCYIIGYIESKDLEKQWDPEIKGFSPFFSRFKDIQQLLRKE